MPPLPGEERLLTVFADVHYYFTAPTPRPLHHRFDKGSYVYLYDNPQKRRARLEIANNPGSPEQDAFHGTLDAAHLRYSHKFPTLCTITVDGLQHSLPGSSPPPDQVHEWRLASADPRDEGRFLFRLHTLDLYFWTLEDANLFMESAKRVLSSRQVEIPDAPQSSPREVASPVVQQLENVAISDPAYHNGQTRNSRPQSTSVPLPPPMAPPAPAQPVTRTPESPKSEPPAPIFAPLAYNPAAPAAPEPIKHREKTPPPPDAEDGTGLAAAAAADHGYGLPPSSIPPPPGQGHYFTGPGGTAAQPTPWGAPPPPGVGITHQPSVSSATSGHRNSSTGTPYAPSGTTAATQPTPRASVSFAPPPTQPQNIPQDPNARYSQSSPPAVQSPGAQIYGAPPYGGSPSNHQPLQHLQPQYANYLEQRPQQQAQPVPPLGGYANYSYSQAPEHHHHHHSVSGQGGSEYDVHSQLYRPTEDEAKSHGKRHSSSAGQGQKPGKMEDRAGKVEGGVNRFLKKLEKKIG